jgi:hypothetical protein
MGQMFAPFFRRWNNGNLIQDPFGMDRKQGDLPAQAGKGGGVRGMVMDDGAQVFSGLIDRQVGFQFFGGFPRSFEHMAGSVSDQ